MFKNIEIYYKWPSLTQYYSLKLSQRKIIWCYYKKTDCITLKKSCSSIKK